jgi:hypothetical protein
VLSRICDIKPRAATSSCQDCIGIGVSNLLPHDRRVWSPAHILRSAHFSASKMMLASYGMIPTECLLILEQRYLLD